MLIGRFLFLMPLLAVAGSLAAKKRVPVTSGTLPTHGPLFVGLLVGTVVIVGALTFFPALSLGPIVEHFLMHQRQAVLDGHAFPDGVDHGSNHVTADAERRPQHGTARIRRRCCRRSWRASRPLFDPEIVGARDRGSRSSS